MLHLKLLLIIECLLGNYALCPISPWSLTLCPSKWSPLGKGLLLGGFIDESLYHSYHTYHFSHFIIFISLSFGIFGCTDTRRDYTSFHGKRG
jgi:hypothetical protein